MSTHEDPRPSEAESPAPQPGRRKLLVGLAAGLGALATAAAGVPVLGFLFRPWVRWRQDQWVDVGRVGGFPEGETYLVTADNPVVEPWAGATAKVNIYVRRKGGEFTIFAVNCAHLECPVSWFPESGLFRCPCHGGVYTEDGKNVAGPPPRPLYRYQHRVEKGRLLVLLGHLPNLSEPS
jgi:menaquinol-cytochrome c reductase iron-sulfur subunit